MGHYDAPSGARKGRGNISSFARQFAAGDSDTEKFSGTDAQTQQMDSVQEIMHQKRQFLKEFQMDSLRTGSQDEKDLMD